MWTAHRLLHGPRWDSSSDRKKRRMEVEDGKAPDSHRDCLCEGWRCCHLLSPLCACIMPECPLSKHACAHERPLRLWACARPQKRVNASVRLAGLLRRARTGLQAGILMSVFWLEKEECNLQRALTVKLPVPEMWGLIGKSVRLWFDHVTSYILVR